MKEDRYRQQIGASSRADIALDEDSIHGMDGGLAFRRRHTTEPQGVFGFGTQDGQAIPPRPSKHVCVFHDAA